MNPCARHRSRHGPRERRKPFREPPTLRPAPGPHVARLGSSRPARRPGLLRLGVVLDLAEVDEHAGLVTDDPSVVTRSDVDSIARAALTLAAVIHDDVHAPRYDIAEVSGLASVGAGDRLNVFRPAPTGLEHTAADRPRGEVDDVRRTLVVCKRPHLIRTVERLDIESCHDLAPFLAGQCIGYLTPAYSPQPKGVSQPSATTASAPPRLFVASEVSAVEAAQIAVGGRAKRSDKDGSFWRPCAFCKRWFKHRDGKVRVCGVAPLCSLDKNYFAYQIYSVAIAGDRAAAMPASVNAA